MLFVTVSIVTGLQANGTLYGTSIQNTVSVTYGDAAGVTQYTTSSSVDTTVERIAGDTLSTPSDVVLVGVGSETTVTYTVTNTGNSSSTFSIVIKRVEYSGGADSWDFVLGTLTDSYAGGYLTDIDSGDVWQGTITIGPISEDGSETFSLVFRSDTDASNSPDQSSATATVNVTGAYSSITFNEQYTGDNSVVYARNGSGDSDLVAAIQNAPNITISKTVSLIDAGSAPDVGPIPGATLQYSITVNNAGSINAQNIIVFDTVPYTTTPGDIVEFDTLTASSGWNAYWATDANSHRRYVGAADTYWFNFFTTTPASFGIDTGAVRFIKWETTNLGGGDQTQTFNVTIN